MEEWKNNSFVLTRKPTSDIWLNRKYRHLAESLIELEPQIHREPEL